MVRSGNVTDNGSVSRALTAKLGELREFVDTELATAVGSHGDSERLISAMNYSLLAPGKRLRPSMCLLACEMCDGDPIRAMPTACALEMLHAATLIHDDLPAMDNDEFRRGRPSNHIVFGEGMAMLAGDALLAYSLEFILRRTRDASDQVLLRVMTELIRVVGPAGLSGGQAIDLECQGRAEVDVATLVAMHERKTGSLIKASVVTGALIAEAPAADVATLASYARKVGLAYQITDDILDEVASFDELGKVTGRDKERSKWTFPRIMGSDGASARARELVDSAILDLDRFGNRATWLVELAQFIYQRVST